MYDAQNSIHIVNHTTVLVQFLSRSKSKSRGLKLTFDIKDITLAEIAITTSYYFFLRLHRPSQAISRWKMSQNTEYLWEISTPQQTWARSIEPKFPEISVQNSMDRFGPTGKVSKKRVHLLRWTTFPGRTGWKFGWMDRAQSFRHIDLLADARPASFWCGTQSKMAESDIGVYAFMFYLVYLSITICRYVATWSCKLVVL